MAFENNGLAVRTLHARLADAVAGYRNGIERTSSHAVAASFEARRALHDQHMGELSRLMLSEGMKPYSRGSWTTLAHLGMMNFDNPVERMDARVTAAITRGERMLADLYDDAVESMHGHPEAQAMLTRQFSEMHGLFDEGDIRAAA